MTFDVVGNGDQVYYYFSNNNTNYNSGPFSTGTHTVSFSTDYTGTETIFFSSWDLIADTGWTIDNISIREADDTTPAFVVRSYDGTPWLTVGNNILGNIGIGVSNPEAKLDIAGSIKISDGTEGSGYVLTSDANGLAYWAPPA